MDLEKRLAFLEKGHKVCKLQLLKRWEPTHKKLTLNRANKQIMLSKIDANSSSTGSLSCSRSKTLDIRLIKEVHTLAFILHTMKINDKWTKDKEIRTFPPNQILVIYYGSQFIPNYWIFFFEKPEICRWWSQGIEHLIMENASESSVLSAHLWVRRQFCALMNPLTGRVGIKHLKPFVQSSLQYKLQSKQLLDFAEEEIDIEKFLVIYSMLTHVPSIFIDRFPAFSDDGRIVSFQNFMRFLKECQKEEKPEPRSVCEMVRRYLRDIDPSRDSSSPFFTILEFCNYLFSRENSIFDPRHLEVIQDMTRPLSHYWIASSHNTYLTGDQLRSESSLDAYARALLSGCRCIELLTVTVEFKVFVQAHPRRRSKKAISYAFFPLTNLAAAAYAQLVVTLAADGVANIAAAAAAGIRGSWPGTTHEDAAVATGLLGWPEEEQWRIQRHRHLPRLHDDFETEFKGCTLHDPPLRLHQQPLSSDPLDRGQLLSPSTTSARPGSDLGDLLLTNPVNRDESELPSPEAMKRKIILKHKKLPLDGEVTSTFNHAEEDQETDVLARECVKRSILMWRDSVTQEWNRHVVVLTSDRMYITIELVEDDNLEAFLNRDDAVSQMGDDEDEGPLFDIRPEEMHVTEEWFHGKTDSNKAKERLLTSCPEKENGTFLVRESSTFIGDYSLSFIFDGSVHHCRIRSKIQDGIKRYSFQEVKFFDTLYELISYHTQVMLETPKFSVLLTTACPQPQLYLNEPWFAPEADQRRAEELLNTVHEDGTFLVRYSSVDRSVFVLSLRSASKIWHYRLKRDGRIFVVNQTVFESLNKIVAYYGTHDFVRGVSLKYPVNERTVGQYASGELTASAPGFYMDLKDLTREIEVRSIRAFVGTLHDHLSFPANATIRVTRKEPDLWKGRYGNNEGWFRPDYVEEVAPSKSNVENMYNIIELGGISIEKIETDRKFSFCITQGQIRETFSCETEEELTEWVATVNETASSVKTKMLQLRNKEKHLRIAAELSNLVVYCQAVPFNAQNVADGSFYEMCSFSETRHEKIPEKSLIQFNSRQLSRVYPMASRMTSSNFNPVPMWNTGCQMVALNYQTPDKAMQLNYGKFLANGRCGYLLKPEFLFDPNFRADTMVGMELSVTVIAAVHLTRKDRSKGICSPFVEVEIAGMNCDTQAFSTRTISSNGLNPVWNETFTFRIHSPEVAMFRFLVQDGDFVSDPFMGQAVFPVNCIRGGYRSVPLLNQYSDQLELSSLLVHVRITRSADQFQQLTPVSERRSQFGKKKSFTLNSFESDHQSGGRSPPSYASSSQPSSVLAAARAGVTGATVVTGSSPSSTCFESIDQLSPSSLPQITENEPPVQSPRKSSSTNTLRKLFKFGSQKGDKSKG
ncbi:hypothetical protein L596_003136 [Steinernema carpocapsae]|uniref:Phosphoinositide phospholipase C n=1 Tax=Steinernema carpocapsae TaxID=34508 RepID=A0A4V6I7M7_STECR|nr:hypothetical protein L596_003136 [Steinernema carpocapsae]